MNLKATLVVVGLIAGAAVGWFTAPKAAVDIKAGPLSVTVQGSGGGGSSGGTMTVTGTDGGVKVDVRDSSPFNDPGLRTALFAAICAVVGLGAGYLIEMRKG